MEAPSMTRPPWWPLPALVALAFFIFWPTLEFTAFGDDHSALWNSGVRGIPWRNGFFRPLSDITFRIGHLAHGSDTGCHRTFNVVVHGFNAFLLFSLFIRSNPRIGDRERTFSALAASLLFILYPFHQESIVWLVGRESSLGTFFVLLGLLMVSGTLPRAFRIVALAACMVIGALCYESALLLFPLALLIVWTAHSCSTLTKREALIALVGGTTVYLGLRSALVGWSSEAYVTGFLTQTPLSLVYHIPKAMARLFLPPDPDPQAQLLKGALLLAGLLVGIVALVRTAQRSGRRSDAAFIWIGLLSISCSIPALAGVSTATSESDRFLYMPSAFLCGLFGFTFQRIPSVAIRRAVWLLLAMLSFHFLKADHKNWEQASMITRQIMERLPEAPEHGRLFVADLPDNLSGAFIFRNGFTEAVFLDGRNGDRYIPVPFAAEQHPAAFNFRDRTIVPMEHDQWIHWTDGVFKADRTDR